MVTREADVAEIWEWLAEIPDPEIPAISILDLGIVRDVAWSDEGAVRALRVAVTPTYSGCPAIAAIERDIVRTLHEHGIEHVRLAVQLAPAWTTDWMTAAGREKLRRYGISPPRPRALAPTGTIDLLDVAPAANANQHCHPELVEGRDQEQAACPRCGSIAVEEVSRFGSTPCKALYRCTACREPFDHFKAH
jgi:ring-1,2-phenylacetyl-CoA epoxidase subunit PaaD